MKPRGQQNNKHSQLTYAPASVEIQQETQASVEGFMTGNDQSVAQRSTNYKTSGGEENSKENERSGRNRRIK